MDKVAESDSAGSPHSVLQLSDSPPHANGDADSKASGSSLSADSEPFVPSADSSEQVTPRCYPCASDSTKLPLSTFLTGLAVSLEWPPPEVRK